MNETQVGDAPIEHKSIKMLLSICWLACGLLLSAKPFLLLIEYFRNTGLLFRVVQALPVLLMVAVVIHGRLRSNGLWRHELKILAAAPLAIALLAEPRATVVVAVMALSALGLGLLASSWLALEDAEGPVVFLLGLGGLIIVLATVGALGWFHPWVFGVIATAPLLLLIHFRRAALAALQAPFQEWNAASEMASPVAGLAVFFALIFACCTLLTMLTPVMAFDVLFYHLPLAELYARSHILKPDALIPQSYYPQGFEVLMSMAGALGGRQAAQMMSPLFFVLFLWLVFRVARVCGEGRVGAVLGTMAAATLPFLHWTGSVPKNDLPLAAFQLASLYAFLQWWKGRRFAWIIAGVFLLAQTFGVKHVALFGAIPLGMMFAYAVVREQRPWRAAIIAVAVFALSGCFWHVATYIRTGNPVFPERSQATVQTGLQAHATGAVSIVARYVTMPWLLFFDGKQAFESPTKSPLGMFLVFFAPVPLLMRRSGTPARRICTFFIVLYLAYWSTVMIGLRYAIVPFALLAPPVAGALTRMYFESPLSARLALGLGVYASFVFALLALFTFEVNSLQIAYLLKRVDTEGYLSRALPATPVLFHLRELDAHASIFGVDDCARLYAPEPMRFGCMLCVEGRCTSPELRKIMGTARYDYLVLPAKPGFDGLKNDLFANQKTVEVHRDSQFVAYRWMGISSQ